MGAPPSAGVWHHGAFAYDGKRSILYEDGKPTVSMEATPQPGPVTRCEFGRYWGGNTGTATEYYRGMLDEVRVYDRVLFETEIRELASARE